MTQILLGSSPGEVRAAAMAEGRLEAFALHRPGAPDGVGDVYRARVVAHVPGMAGAFLQLPEGEGFLPDSEGGEGAVEGALLTVRVTRSGQGGKGPRLSAKVPQGAGPPGLVERGGTAVEELLDRYKEAAIVADDPVVAAALRARHGDRVTFGRGAFEAAAEEVDLLASAEMALPSGMRASVTPTPALVAIDMDMASATGLRQPKAAAQLAANLAALPELARQIRLRNLSGAILLDPAGLSTRRRAALGPTLAEALAKDPLRPRLLGWTALGLAEIVRPRVRPPLHELLTGPHAAGLRALRALAREAEAVPAVRFGLVAAADVAEALRRDPAALADLARRTGRPSIPLSDPGMVPGSWRIERRA